VADRHLCRWCAALIVIGLGPARPPVAASSYTDLAPTMQKLPRAQGRSPEALLQSGLAASDGMPRRRRWQARRRDGRVPAWRPRASAVSASEPG